MAELTEQVTALAIEGTGVPPPRLGAPWIPAPRRKMRRLVAAIQGWKSPAAQPHQILSPVADSRSGDGARHQLDN